MDETLETCAQCEKELSRAETPQAIQVGAYWPDAPGAREWNVAFCGPDHLRRYYAERQR